MTAHAFLLTALVVDWAAGLALFTWADIRHEQRRRYRPCQWRGPDGRRCVLYRDHPLMRVGYHGHVPDQPIRGHKPGPTVDPHGFVNPERTHP